MCVLVLSHCSSVGIPKPWNGYSTVFHLMVLEPWFFGFKRGTEGGLLGLADFSSLIQFMVFGQLSKHPFNVGSEASQSFSQLRASMRVSELNFDLHSMD